MSWIQENKFLVALGGATLAGLIALYFVGAHGAGGYADAKEQFDAAAADASGFERLSLYPKKENANMKDKALKDYRASLEAFQEKFAPYRPADLKNISPQEFADHLLAANKEVRKAFEDAGATLPEQFFVGFEDYKSKLASPNSTGLLNYQLEAIKSLLLELAKTKPAELRNLFRPAIPEESGGSFDSKDAVARQFPLEITFTGPEKSVRNYLSAIMKLENQFVVVRSLRIKNEKKDPPRKEDAHFEAPAGAAAPGAAAADVFSGFVLPGDDTAAPAPEAPKPAGEPAAPAPEAAAPSPAPGDTCRILYQVLGEEKVMVFLRLDLMEFLPAKKLP
jgi:hypothetical protein